MRFFTAISTGFKKWCDLKGRASRSEFWWWFIFLQLTSLFVVVIEGYLHSPYFGWSIDFYSVVPFVSCQDPSEMIAELRSGDWASLVATAVFLLLAVPTATLAIRRAHDLGYSGWLGLMPSIGFILGRLLTQLPSIIYAIGAMILLAASALWLVVIILYFSKGNDGWNRYGADPSEEGPTPV